MTGIILYIHVCDKLFFTVIKYRDFIIKTIIVYAIVPCGRRMTWKTSRKFN